MAEKPYHDVLCTHVNLKEHDKLRAALEKYSPNAPAKEPRTPLLCAVTENDWESAAMLLDAGADPNFVSTSTNSTLLGRCVEKSNLEFAKKLLAYKSKIAVNVNLRDKDGQSAAAQALLNKKFDFFDMFLAHGLDANAADEWGNTFSHMACSSPEALNYYSKKPSFNISARDANGSTPLHHAAVNYNKEVGKLLVSLGADKTIRNNDGKTPIEMMIPDYQAKEEWRSIFA